MQLKSALNGKEINLTGDNTTIKSNNFNVDKDGNMSCKNATMDSAKIEGGNLKMWGNTTLDGVRVFQDSSKDVSYMAYMVSDVIGVNKGDERSAMMSNYIGTGNSSMLPNEISSPIITQTSLERKKKNFEKLEDNAIETIKNIDIYKYNLKTEKDTDKKHLGFSSNGLAENKDNSDEKTMQKEYEETKKEVMAELKKELRPEFINRIDDIIVFHKLNDEEINSIIDLLLKNVEQRLVEQGLNIKIDKSVKELIAKKGVDKEFGARPLRRAIQNIVEDKLAEEILDGNIKPGLEAKLVAKDDKVELKVKAAK